MESQKVLMENLWLPAALHGILLLTNVNSEKQDKNYRYSFLC